MPALLLYGTAGEIALAAGSYLLGYLALAMVLQGTEPVRGKIALWQRGVLLASAFCLLFPTALWIDALGVALLVAGWLPAMRARRAV